MADSLLQEVDDALRADKFTAFWRQYRATFLTVAVSLVIGTAANSAWEHYREVKGGAMLERLSANQQLLEKGKAEEAAKGFAAIAADARGEFKDLAWVWQARALIAADQTDDAVAVLKTAVADASNLWTDVACLRLAGLDSAAAVPCLGKKTNSPLASTRAEWSAAALWEKGDHAGAIAAVEKLVADKDTAADSRQRLTQWLTSMKSVTAAK